MIYDTLVLSGGGTKGFSQLGLLHRIYDKLPYIQTYTGTSIGAIISFMLSIGYDPISIYLIFQDIHITDKISLPSLYADYGLICDNPCIDKLKEVMYKEFGKLPTFRELYNLTNKNLIIIGTNLDTKTLEIFSHITHPDMDVLLALDISSRIPIMFTSIEYNGNRYVDGGISCNFPLHIVNDGIRGIIAISCINDKTEDDSLVEYINTIMDIKSSVADNITDISDNVLLYRIKCKNTSMFKVNKDERWNLFLSGFKTQLYNRNNIVYENDLHVHPIVCKYLNSLNDQNIFEKFLRYHFGSYIRIISVGEVKSTIAKIVSETTIKHPINRIFSSVKKWITQR